MGGANSIRAFTVRSIGPGGYHPAESRYSYLDQTGTFRFEANVEMCIRDRLEAVHKIISEAERYLIVMKNTR